jgi:hypothetical protein
MTAAREHLAAVEDRHVRLAKRRGEMEAKVNSEFAAFLTRNLHRRLTRATADVDQKAKAVATTRAELAATHSLARIALAVETGESRAAAARERLESLSSELATATAERDEIEGKLAQRDAEHAAGIEGDRARRAEVERAELVRHVGVRGFLEAAADDCKLVALAGSIRDAALARIKAAFSERAQTAKEARVEPLHPGHALAHVEHARFLLQPDLQRNWRKHQTAIAALMQVPPDPHCSGSYTPQEYVELLLAAGSNPRIAVAEFESLVHRRALAAGDPGAIAHEARLQRKARELDALALEKQERDERNIRDLQRAGYSVVVPRSSACDAGGG